MDIVARQIHEIQNINVLIKKEKDWRDTFNSLEDVLLIIDNEFNIENINISGLYLLKSRKEDIVGKKCYKVIRNKKSPCGFCPFNKTLTTRTVTTNEWFEIKFQKYISLKISPIFNKQGKIIKFVNLIRDITQNKLMEKDLTASNDYVKNIIDSSLDMIITTDKKRKIVEFNKAAQKTYGYKPEEIAGKHINILYADLKESLKVHKTVLKEERLFREILSKRKNGEVFPCYLSSSLLRNEHNKIIGIMGISRDITKYKKIKKARLEIAEEFKHTIQGLHNQIFRYRKNKQGEYVLIISEGKIAEELGITTDKIKGKTIPRIFNKDMYYKISPFFKKAFTGETVKYQTGFCGRCFETILAPFEKNKDGKVIEIIGSSEDITERKKAEKKLHESEKKYRELINAWSQVYWAVITKILTTLTNDFLSIT